MRIQAMAVLLAGCFLGACSTGINMQTLRSPDDEKEAVSKSYRDCLRNAAIRIDDGKTAVDAVIAKVSTQCASSYASLKATLSHDLGGDAREKFEADMDANRLVGVRDVVMRHRSEGLAASNPNS